MFRIVAWGAGALCLPLSALGSSPQDRVLIDRSPTQAPARCEPPTPQPYDTR